MSFSCESCARRLDLASAHREVELLADALAVTRRWQLLGGVEVGLERERETDGVNLMGPTLELALPLFDQGQLGISRAEAELEQSRARLAETELELESSVRWNFELILSKQKQYDVYATYLEGVRGYWVEWTALARAVGGYLPGGPTSAPAAGAEAVFGIRAKPQHEAALASKASLR